MSICILEAAIVLGVAGCFAERGVTFERGAGEYTHFGGGYGVPQLSPLCNFWGDPLSGGRGCLGDGRLGVPGRVWELRFLPSFPSFPRESRSPKNVWENVWKSQTSFFQTSAAFWP